MKLYSILQELDSDDKLKSDIKELIFAARGKGYLELDFKSMVNTLTDMNHSIDESLLKSILKEIEVVRDVTADKIILDSEAEVEELSAERQNELDDRVEQMANSNAMAGVKDDIV